LPTDLNDVIGGLELAGKITVGQTGLTPSPGVKENGPEPEHH